jgi:small subunit ribosomal protein S2
MSSEENKIQSNDPIISAMFEAGAHFGYSKSKRHPSMANVIFGIKNRVEIFDLEKTKPYLDKAKAFIENLVSSGKNILFVGGKTESHKIIKEGAELAGMPYVSGRWIGGTLTNFGQIKTRTGKLVDLRQKREKGELIKYTKKERLMIDRDIERLEAIFSGLISMNGLPGALFVIDPKKEKTAVAEAQSLRIPVVSLMSSDCDLNSIDYPMPGNDSSMSSIKFFTSEIVSSAKIGKSRHVPISTSTEVKS